MLGSAQEAMLDIPGEVNIQLTNAECFNCWQVAKLQQEVAAMRKLAAPPPPASPAGAVWRLVLGVAAVAARAAAAATGALAMIYAAVALPGVRNALHAALAAEPGTVRLPVLAVLGVAVFMATALSVAAGQVATARTAV